MISRAGIWVIVMVWVIFIPALLAVILWELFVVRPQDQHAIVERQKQLVRDDIVIIHNQRMLCAALKVECMKESDAIEEGKLGP